MFLNFSASSPGPSRRWRSRLKCSTSGGSCGKGPVLHATIAPSCADPFVKRVLDTGANVALIVVACGDENP